MSSMPTLATFPFVVVRITCKRCPRAGQYRLARLVERYGADMPLTALLEALAADCERRQRHGMPGVDRCGARFADLVDGPPPDVPFTVPKITAARARDER